MGREAHCRAICSGREAEGRLLLEEDGLRFRGPLRLHIPRESIRQVTAVDGVLRVVGQDGDATFLLGDAAERWARDLLHPPSRLDKLGIRAGTRVSVLGIADRALGEELTERGAVLVEDPDGRSAEVILWGMESQGDLPRMFTLRTALSPGAFLWIVYPKGSARLPQQAVLTAGREAGLIDTKVARFSSTHTALRFGWPKAAGSRSARR